MAEPSLPEESIFLHALHLESPAERAAYLDQACADQPQLRAEVEALLRANNRSGDLLDLPEQPADTVMTPVREGPGTIIGPYKLLEQVGEGGMGVVYSAEQSRPVRRKVALKLIKPGMDSKTVLSRFEAERQALAIMEHPNIARVFDGGITPSGRPFFVMEYVKGVPFTENCDEARLTIRERLALFVQVCQAVQHAHQKGIIHRDLKPTNVLICLYDGVPVPKVIDFGLAKAMHQPLTEHTLYTGQGVMMGTPLYMSPEQAEVNNLDVDTRTDIYTLGVLLYEVLTGTTPLEKEKFQKAAWQEMLRLIKEEEPPRPSLRLSGSGSLPSVAAQRRLEPAKLSRLVRGELDWIVMKCLEKDRARRYGTASGLARDLERYLADDPVEACPPSTAYRLRKFARRHRGRVLAASLVLLALVGGIIGTSVGLIAARRQEARANAERDEKEDARQAAQASAEKARRREEETQGVLDFVENKILAAGRPKSQDGGLGRDVPMPKAIEAAIPFVHKSFENQPLIEARLCMILGKSVGQLGNIQLCTELFQRAVTIRTRELGREDLETLASMNNLAIGYDATGRYPDALKLQEEVLRLRKVKLGSEHRDTLLSMHNLAHTYSILGRYVDALELYEEALPLQKAKLGPGDHHTLLTMLDLGETYITLGRMADAIRVLEEAVRQCKASLGPDHALTLGNMTKLGSTYDKVGRHGEALKLHEEALALQKTNLGVDHPDTLTTLSSVADCYEGLGRKAEALKLREETLKLTKAKQGFDHPDTLARMYELACSYSKAGRHSEALKLLEDALPLQKAKVGPDHPDTLVMMRSLAESLVKLERGAEAVTIIDECLRRAEGKAVDPNLIPGVMDLRLRHYAKAKDAVGCRATAAMWEKLKRTDAASLYNAACNRAVTAGVILTVDKFGRAGKDAAAESDQAMAWLKQAIAAGFHDAAHMKEDKDLDALRNRGDFKKLLAELEAKGKPGTR
jgi:serine/threonine protein kinase